jgi:Cep192 domain 4
MSSPFGIWNITADGNVGPLLINDNPTGGIGGTIFGDPLVGLFNSTEGTLYFLRKKSSDETQFEVYTGRVFAPVATSNSGTKTSTTLLLAGNFEVYPTTGAVSQFGWFAQPAPQGGPAISCSPTSLTFPAQEVGTTSVPQTVTLTSIGTTQYSIGSKLILGTNASSFSKTDTCGADLQPGEQCTMSVVFTPAAIGLLTAQLEVTNTDPSIAALTIQLNGIGVSPKIVTKDTKEGKELKESDKTQGIDKVPMDVPQPLRPPPSTDISAAAGGEGATQRAFISPGERPPVGPRA